MDLKRLWDTENKKIVRAVNADTNKEYQVWTNDDGSKLYIYDIEWKELSASLDVCEYGPVWKELEDETVGYYLTNKPTDLYNWDEGEEVAYAFKNGSTTLQSGKVDEGETPEYTGETPTKTDVKPYITYEFNGWKPEVGPIYKKTDFKAQFTKTEIALQNYVLPDSENTLCIFGNSAASDYVEVLIEEDEEVGEKSSIVTTYGLFDDEFFVGTYDEEDQNGWEYIFGQLDPEDVEYLISEGNTATDGEWKSGIWSAFQTYYATPNKTNADAVITAIEATRDDVSGKLDPITWTEPQE